ncbi:putative NinH protein [Pectobacterium phage Possum]|uniref:Putative NinH protein n=1 Tax=Pectobacterium phage Possum TaxID=2686301 RepID=A0A7T0Q284_9CAUD|nr:putative NinH protein [Pectobacterium phage Possum]QPL10899.1 putative NinH protein [Pectobacterium phage Possum]QPL11001.1 putative NinH protein [Pectobacterium phage Horatius]
MTVRLHSIPLILNQQYGGNGARMAEATGLSELTISKYREDWNCKQHIVIDGELFTKHKCTKPFEVDHGNVPNFSGRIHPVVHSKWDGKP